jgi:hypothetical protein
MKNPISVVRKYRTTQNKVLKVCVDPNCEEIAHNIDKKETRCRNCNCLMVEINKETYRSKFIENYFQYDYSSDSGEIVTSMQMGYSLQSQLSF